MIKPIGPKCNLNCGYCYYLEKERLYGETSRFPMSDGVLEVFIRDYLKAHREADEVTFVWQGGEPTLLGRSFFSKALALQRRHCPPGLKISNSLQTNGMLLDQRWAVFLRDNGFLVGLSIDGPRRLHDRYRETPQGAPTFEAVRRALRLLQREGVDFNTLSVVHRANARHGRRVYRFLRGEGVRFMQFIPLVERLGPDGRLAPPGAAPEAVKVAPWSVPPQGYGRFMHAVFDEWRRRDAGSVFVRLFDVQLGLWSGLASGLCIFAETCGQDLALEHNGDLYACDHYVYPSHELGNINQRPIGELARAPGQRRFGEDKRDSLPTHCRQCEFLFACNGGCPKHRFAPAPDGQPTLNYLCPSYKHFFGFAGPTLGRMAGLLAQGRPPALAAGMAGGEPGRGRPRAPVSP
ncbi:MAG: anaerobic sulfatase maturase [Rhodospirillales bacterium]